MMRRSVSSCDSPGPREPMPPCVRERCVHRRVRRGSWYSSWASSTCRRPSCVRACWAKMSRISPLRSRTLTPEQALERLLLVGRQLVVGDQQREAGFGLGADVAPRPCPCPHTSSGRRGGGSATRRRRPRRRRCRQGWRAPSSDSSAVQPASWPVSTATRKARSTGGDEIDHPIVTTAFAKTAYRGVHWFSQPRS